MQDGDEVAPAWLMLTLWPATVTVSERWSPIFGAAETVTDPGPDPPSPKVTQLAPLFVVHSQPDAVVTLTVAVPPFSSNASDLGLIA